jgi:large subunit ribosomal protein L25
MSWGAIVYRSHSRKELEMDALSLKLSARGVRGKKVRALRREGMVPVHFYGRGAESQALQVDAGVLRRLLPRAGRNLPVTVEVEGQDGDNVCFIREVQRHPVTEQVLHVDFMRVDILRVMRAQVPVILDGEAPAVRNLGGTLLQVFQTLEVESLPMSMPAAFHLSVDELDDFDKSLRVGDISTDADVTIIREPDEMIARVAAPKIEEEEAPEEEELPEGEVAEGEEAEGAKAEQEAE